MIRRPPRSTHCISSAASDVYKRQVSTQSTWVKDKANFDILDLNPLQNHVKKAFVPAFFIAANQDSFIQPKHTKALYEAYAGDKTIQYVEGDHNSKRPKKLLDQVGIFFYNTLQAVSYTHLRAHETRHDLVCRLLLEKKNNKKPLHVYQCIRMHL
eukprot:TRINITY_DN21021_c0_g1_i1.p2 TRINITY_DN21021_c0_g1~~TRINITY_DN21021_c0_g1_i1.p2  ORF type:complete len:155 (+),score=42.92 TRINITY_DN21021_c0_g1_i1:134-598(+)